MAFPFNDFWKSTLNNEAADEKKKLTPQQKSHQLEIENSLLILAADVLRCEKSFSIAAENVVSRFFEKHFDKKRHAYRIQTILQHIDSGTEPFVKIAAKQLVLLTTYPSRQSIVHFLFSVAATDTFASEKQKRCIKRLAQYMGITETDFAQIQQQFLETNNPYFVLGITENASTEEVKRAYRKLVMQYHPDKQTTQDTAEKFRQIQLAYESIVGK